MKIKPFSRHAAADALSWLLTGAMVLLVMLFSVMIVRDYGRETTAARQTIEEKERADPRAGVRHARRDGMRMHHAQLQALLEEMAWQPGVLWFAVTDENGKIIAHSDPQQVDNALYSPAQMRELHERTGPLAPA
jgi:two-component system sensor histidine kinase HydH